MMRAEIDRKPPLATVFQPSMCFRYLTATAACAALLGLAASVLVRTQLREIVFLLAQDPYHPPSATEPTRTDEGVLAFVGSAPNRAALETRPTSLRSPRFAKKHPTSRAQPSSARNSASEALCRELQQGIRKLGERRYAIKRRSLDLALANLGLLARWVRVKPEARNGQPLGFRLSAIKADGPFAKLGLRNDDVLVSINGLDISTPDHVLGAYGKLKGAHRLVLGLMRDERATIQEYTVR